MIISEHKTAAKLCTTKGYIMMKFSPMMNEKLDFCASQSENVWVSAFGDSTTDSYNSHIADIASLGFEMEKNYNLSDNSFAFFRNGSDTIRIAFYPGTEEIRIIHTKDETTPDFTAKRNSGISDILFTQIHPEDYGLSDVFRTVDGRFIILDGGWEFEPDADKIMNLIKEQSKDEKPIIAAWIMTHPHLDHYRAFFEFYRKYKDDVIIEKFLYNFPEAKEENIEAIPELARNEEIENIKKFEGILEKEGYPSFRLHSGDVFDIGGLHFEVLSSPDDTMKPPVTDFNHYSLVLKVTAEEQVLLLCADAYFKEAKLAERWGKHLKSDILQIPHHGFCGGREAEYDLIDPSVCFAPTFEAIDLMKWNIYSSYNRHLIYILNVVDYFTGKENITIKLPYTPRKYGRKILDDKIAECQKMAGSKCWYFDGVTKNDAIFTFINTLMISVPVYADLYFEDPAKNVGAIKMELRAGTRSKKNLFDTADADPDARYFNRRALAKIGVEDGAEFAVRLYSDYPFIVTWKKEAVYHS